MEKLKKVFSCGGLLGVLAVFALLITVPVYAAEKHSGASNARSMLADEQHGFGDEDYWNITIDDSDCTFAKVNEDGRPIPKITIKSKDGSVVLREGTDYKVEFPEAPKIGENPIILMHLATGSKVSKSYTIDYADIAEYYTLENVLDVIYYTGSVMLWPQPAYVDEEGVHASEDQFKLNGYVEDIASVYLREKRSDMGALPTMQGNGANAPLWNEACLDLVYVVDGREMSWGEGIEILLSNQVERTVTVKVSPKETYGEIEGVQLERRLTGSLSKTVRFLPYSITETRTPAYPPTEVFGGVAEFICTNPQFGGESGGADKKILNGPISSVYTGEAVEPKFTMAYCVYNRSFHEGEKIFLVEEQASDEREWFLEDFNRSFVSSVSYENNLNAGKGKIQITFSGDTNGTITREFTIEPKNISDTSIEILVENSAYTGKKVLPKLTVTDAVRGVVLKEGTDYKVSGGRKELGEGTVTITGIGNYKGDREETFVVTGFALGDETAYEIKTEKVIYNGKAQLPKVTVLDKKTNKVLKQNTDFIVEAASKADNVNAGTGKAKVVGITVSGSVEKEFVIEPKAFDNNIEITPQQVVYNGASQLPVVQVTDKSLGRTLKKETDFTVAAEAGADNVNTGTGKAVLTGIGNYTGTKAFAFTIVSSAEPGAPTEPGKPGVPTEPSKPGVPTEPSEPSAPPVASTAPFTVDKREKDSLVLGWKKQKGSDGYQVYMATKKNGKYKRVAQTNGKRKATIKKLKAGTTYYFKVRSFKKSKGKKIYKRFSKPVAISTRLEKPKFTSVKSTKKRTVTVKWKRDKRADGYQIYLKKGKGKFKLAKEIRNNKKVSYSITKLSSRSKVTVRLRSYQTVGGKKYYSPYTSSAQIRVK